MDESAKKERGKKKTTKVKTFPIPFAFGDINDNISVTTNSSFQSSKEELIKKAIKFHSEGNISKAKR